MVGTALSPTALPKSAALTDALVAPAEDLLADDELSELKTSFLERLGTAAEGLGPDRVLIDAFRLRVLTSEAPDDDRPFQWSPFIARRSIGIEAARACLARPGLTPLVAVNEEVAGQVRRHDQEGSPGRGLSAWLAGLGTGALAVVVAEAAGWTSQLVSSLEWTRVTNPVVGANRRLVVPSAPNIALRMKFEVAHRSDAVGKRRTPTALFMMMTGRPASTIQNELSLAALTLALDDRHPSVPSRVVGWWPQSGRGLVLPVTRALLDGVAHQIVEAVRRMPRSADKPQARSVSKRTSDSVVPTPAIGADLPAAS
jgi:hypothetical protein